MYEYKHDKNISTTPGDMKVVIKIGNKIYEIGHLFSYSLQSAREVIPRQAFGDKYSVGQTRGKRQHNGVLVFNVINTSIVHELRKQMMLTKNEAVSSEGAFSSHIADESTFMGADEELSKVTDDLVTENTDDDLISATELPSFDLYVTAKDPLNPNRYTQKKIIGIHIVGHQGAIGLDTITTQEQYPFVCKSTTPLTAYDGKDVPVNDAANGIISTEGEYESLVIS